MPETFWIEEYRKKAALTDAVAQSGRGNNFNSVDFLYLAKQAVELLRLRPEHALLDVGCANGLFDIILSACCRSILAVEPVAELASLARQNLAGCPNVRVEVGHGGAIPAPDQAFDRIVMLGVLQLVPPREAKLMFQEFGRVIKPGGRVLIVAIPDARHKQSFLEPYLDGVRRAGHLTEEQKKQIAARHAQSHWYDFDELRAWWVELGGRCTRHPPAAVETDKSPRFHLDVTFSA
jgi:cyclopropane fatty-acyl-phospholipid synthase-like methyltransferase